MPRCHFTLEPRGPFSMTAAREMQCGFLRGARTCNTDPWSVKLAFPRDGDFAVVGASIRHVESSVHVEVEGAVEPGRVRDQVARTLGLDHDAAPFQRVLASHPVLRSVAAARPGFRPVVAPSPYVMGGWAILSQRLRMNQAATLQVRIAERAGDVVQVAGEWLSSFPRPQSILARDGFPGVPEEKWRRLVGLAEAALSGALDITRLAAMPYADARADLKRLRGVGPWTADAILLRGCGPTDELPVSEPTLHEAVRAVYGLSHTPDDGEVERIAEAWRPFRMWVSVLLIAHAWKDGRSRVRSPDARRRGRPAQGRAGQVPESPV
jgi:DNA-3-methyladenine glycosylase II